MVLVAALEEEEWGSRSENRPQDAMAFDDVFVHLGDFGRYQKRVYFLLCLTVVVVAFHKLAGVFLEPDVAYRYSTTPWLRTPQVTVGKQGRLDVQDTTGKSCGGGEKTPGISIGRKENVLQMTS